MKQTRLLLAAVLFCALLFTTLSASGAEAVRISASGELPRETRMVRSRENHPILVAYQGESLRLVDWPGPHAIYNREWGGLAGLYDPYAEDLSVIAYPDLDFTYAVTAQGNGLFRLILDQSPQHVISFGYTYVFDAQNGTILPLAVGDYFFYKDIRFFENGVIALLTSEGGVELLYPDGQPAVSLEYVIPGAHGDNSYFAVDVQYDPLTRRYILIYARQLPEPRPWYGTRVGTLSAVAFDQAGEPLHTIDLSGLYASYIYYATDVGSTNTLEFAHSYIADGVYYIKEDFYNGVARYNLNDLLHDPVVYDNGEVLTTEPLVPVSIAIDLEARRFGLITTGEVEQHDPAARSHDLPVVVQAAGGRCRILGKDGATLMELPAGYAPVLSNGSRQGDRGYMLFAYSG